jgi:hypothetical protein
MDGVGKQLITILFSASYIALIVAWVWIIVLASRNAIWKSIVCFVVPITTPIYGFRHWNDVTSATNTRLATKILFLALGSLILSVLMGKLLSPA